MLDGFSRRGFVDEQFAVGFKTMSRLPLAVEM
jgi:hypothetical protein